MKNLFKTIKEMIRATYKGILTYEGIVLGSAAVGIIIAMIIAATSDDGVFVNMGSFMCMMGTMIIIFFGLVFTCSADFVLAISYGKSRTCFVIARYLVYVAEMGFGFAILKLVNVFETWMGTRCDGIDFISIPSGLTLLVAAFVLPVIVMAFSALYVRFERKAFWVLWVIWMAVALGAPRVSTAMKNSPESVAAKIGFFFKNAISIGSTQFIIVAAIVGVLALIADFIMYRYLEAKL